MKSRAASEETHGFTLAELTISMAASVIVLGALFMSSTAMQKAMRGSELYALSYSDQRRLIDFLARDLRRAIALSATDGTGAPAVLAGQSIEISDRATLTVTLPAYYQSDLPADASFDRPLAVVATGERLDYGTSGTPAPPVEVCFKKIHVAAEEGICFVREEAGTREIIARDAGHLHLRFTIAADGQSGIVQAWFRSTYSTLQTLVETHDEIMLRNPRTE